MADSQDREADELRSTSDEEDGDEGRSRSPSHSPTRRRLRSRTPKATMEDFDYGKRAATMSPRKRGVGSTSSLHSAPGTSVDSSTPECRRPMKSFDQHCEEFAQKAKPSVKKNIDDFTKPDGRARKPSPEPLQNNVLYLLVIFGGISAILAGYFYFQETKSSEPVGTTRTHVFTWEDAQQKVMQKIQHLHSSNFRSQKRETMVHLLAALNSTVARDVPKQPSSIVLLVPPSVPQSFALCFSQKIAQISNEAYAEVQGSSPISTFKMDAKYFQRYGDDITGIHQQLKSYFKSGGRGIVISDVEKISKEEHLNIFHSLCDNSHAPEKRAVLFFVLPVPQDIMQQYSWTYNRASELSNDVLQRAWKSVTNDDSRPAYIARVAATVVLLEKGDKC